MLKFVTIVGLLTLLIFSSAGTVFAQDESSFNREATISKRDAVVLSVLFPGLGQMTQGHKVKGISMFIGEVASLVMFINAHENYNTKQKIYDRDLDIFNNLKTTKSANYQKSYTDANKLYKSLQDQNDDLDNLHSIRNTAIIIAAGVYAYNLFDEVFLSSSTVESKRAEHNKNKIKVKSALIDRNPGIILSKRF